MLNDIRNVKVLYQGALVLDPNGPYKDYGFAKRVRGEIAAEEREGFQNKSLWNAAFMASSWLTAGIGLLLGWTAIGGCWSHCRGWSMLCKAP